MNKINLNHWFIDGNIMSISLLRYHVEISILKNNSFIYYGLDIINNDREKLVFNLYTLEDAIYFVENIVAISTNYDEILCAYEKMVKGKMPQKITRTRRKD